jgi:hypothetical protein
VVPGGGGVTPRVDLQILADQLGLDILVAGGSHENFVINFGDGPESFVTFEDATAAIRLEVAA